MSTRRFVAKYYRLIDGTVPVCDFIDDLGDEDVKAKLTRKIEMIHSLCTVKRPNLPFPHSSHIRGDIRELREQHGKDRYRIFYSKSRAISVLLHIVRKDDWKLDESDIDLAEKRWEDFQNRMNAKVRRKPGPLATGFAP